MCKEVGRAGDGRIVGADDAAVPVDEFEAEVGDVTFDVEAENAAGEVLVEGGDDAEVLQGRIVRLAGEVDVALDAADAPEVLALEEGTRRVAVDFQKKLVLAFADEIADVVAGEGLGILVVAHLPAVDIDIDARFRGGEVEVDTAAGPLRRDAERPVVDTARDDLGKGRRLRILRAEVVGDVGIDGRAVALNFPVAGDLDAVPMRFLDFARNDSFIDEGFHVAVVVEVAEVPGAVQVDIVGALAESLAEGGLPGREEHRLGTAGFGIDIRHVDVLPVRQF